MKPITVIVTASGAPGGPSIIQSLRRVDERSIRIIATDIRKDASGLYLADASYIVPMGTDPSYAKELLKIAVHENADAVLPLSSMELQNLSQANDEFAEKGIKVLVSDPSPIQTALNKFKTYTFLKGKDVKEVIPKFFLIKSCEGLEKASHNLGFPNKPFVIKPMEGKGKRGFRIITTEPLRFSNLMEEKPDSSTMRYREFAEIVREAKKIPPFLAMEYLAGNEYTVDALCKDGRPIVTVPRRREKTTLGISTTGCTEHNEKLIEITEKIVKAFGFEYLINAQFKFDENDEPKLLEINPRIAGTICLTVESGVNLPYLALKVALGEKIEQQNVKWGTKIIRYWDHVVLHE
jgi:carbamoyl-phosphate synthase large subunit